MSWSSWSWWRALAQAIVRRAAAALVACLIALGLSWVTDAHAQYAAESFRVATYGSGPTPAAVCKLAGDAYRAGVPARTDAVMENGSGSTAEYMCEIKEANGTQTALLNIVAICSGGQEWVSDYGIPVTKCATQPPPPPPTCNVPAGTKINKQSYSVETDGRIAPSLDFCATESQCKLTSIGRSASQDITTKKWLTTWFGPFTVGEGSCTDNGAGIPPPEEEKPLKCAQGMCTGTVNSVEICVKCENYETLSPQTITTTNPDGTTTTTDLLAGTWCEGVKCVYEAVETTTQKDANGNPIGEPQVKTEKQEMDKQVFCEKNPESGQCKKKDTGSASGGDNCAAAPQCEGDAIQCMMVRQQWKTRCAWEGENPSSQFGAQLIAGSDPNAAANPALPANRSTFDFSNTIDQSGFLGGAGLQDRTFSFLGRLFVIPFSKWNPYIEGMGNVLVALALIMAARIVVGGK